MPQANHRRRIDVIADFILGEEGGWDNDPDDKGGETNRGITLKTYQAYVREKKLPEDYKEFRTMTRELWLDIFHWGYYVPVGGARFNSFKIAAFMTDFGFNSGAYTASKMLQQEVNKLSQGTKLLVDGNVGAKTAAAVNEMNEAMQEVLFANLLLERAKFLYGLTRNEPNDKDKKYIAGWLLRLIRLNREVTVDVCLAGVQ